MEFSKLRFLQCIGLLDRRFNYDTQKLEKSRPLYLYCQLVLLLDLVHCARLFVSIFWRREDSVQLIVGNYFNYLNDECRLLFGLLVSIFNTRLILHPTSYPMSYPTSYPT